MNTLARPARRLLYTNAAYSLADYVVQPFLLLCTTPTLLRHLGLEQYAVWVLASATVSGGALLSNGFGDAAIKYISALRKEGSSALVEQVVRALISLNLISGALIASILFIFAHPLAAHVPHLSRASQSLYAQAVVFAGILLMLRAVENVFISCQRAYECYAIPTRISIVARTTSIVAATLLAAHGKNVIAILDAALVIAILTLAAQAIALRHALPVRNIWPSLRLAKLHDIFHFGFFSWLQSLIGVLTQHADRLLVGYLLGTQALTYYSVCVQAAMPIHGIIAATLQVLFPYLGTRLGDAGLLAHKPILYLALACNTALSFGLATLYTVGGNLFLRHWLGAHFAADAHITFSLVAWSFALLSLNVTAHWTLMAIGRIQVLVLMNALGAAAMLLSIALLARRFGVNGAAAGRLAYGAVTLSIYFALRTEWRSATVAPQLLRTCESD